jgi:hypothetical protein
MMNTKPNTKKHLTQREIGFIQGVIYAAELTYAYQTSPGTLLSEAGITVKDILKYGDPESDEIIGILENYSSELDQE